MPTKKLNTSARANQLRAKSIAKKTAAVKKDAAKPRVSASLSQKKAKPSSRLTNVIAGVKGKRFRIWDDKRNELMHISKPYYSNSDAARACRSFVKRNKYHLLEFI